MDAPLDAPLLLSGALGGPFVVYVLTPMRNALTLGSQDSRSVAAGLYRKVFRGGWASGWKGGGAPAVMACPQFLAVGPAFHVMHQRARELSGSGASSGHRVLPALAASCGAGLFETALTYAAQSRNAQIAYNNAFVSFSSTAPMQRRTPLALNPVYKPWGPGFGAMAVRNMASVSSIRSLSPWLQERLPGSGSLSFNVKASFCDFLACLSACIISAPANQVFNFLATTPSASRKSPAERLALARHFLNRQYFVPLQPDRMGYTAEVERYSWNISRVVARDFCLRSSYAISLLMLFMSIERTLCAVLRPYELKRVCEKSRGLAAQPVEMCLARH